MTNRQIEKTLDRLRDGLPALLDATGFQRNSCILSARLTTYALADLGIRATAAPTSLMVMNAEYAAWAAANAEDPDGPDRSQEFFDRAWSVIIGFGPTSGHELPARTRSHVDQRTHGYDGHMVVIVNGRYLCDFSLGQASRPAKSLPLPRAAWFEIPGQYKWDKLDPQTAIGWHADGVRISYLRSLDQTWRRATDWANPRPRDPLVRAVVRLAHGDRVSAVRVARRPVGNDYALRSASR